MISGLQLGHGFADMCRPSSWRSGGHYVQNHGVLTSPAERCERGGRCRACRQRRGKIGRHSCVALRFVRSIPTSIGLGGRYLSKPRWSHPPRSDELFHLAHIYLRPAAIRPARDVLLQVVHLVE